MNSIRVRVLIAATLVTCVMLVLAGVTLLTLLREGMTQQLDQRLLAAANGLTQAFENVDGEILFEWEGIETGLPLIFRAWNEDATVIAASAEKINFTSMTPIEFESEGTSFISISESELDNGAKARVVTLRFSPRFESASEVEDSPVSTGNSAGHIVGSRADSDAGITLEVAGSLEEINAVISLARWRLFWVSLLATVVSALVLWPVTGLVVRPVNEIAARIAAIDVGLLRERIEAATCPAELRPIASRLNEFISRLAEAFTREKQTTANIAHELRTPLAGLRATLELAESKPRSSEYYQQTLLDCRRITDELQTLVERILLLSRMDAGRLVLSSERVDVKALICGVWEVVSAQCPEASCSMVADIPDSLEVVTDRACLRQVLSNLLMNASIHGTPSQPIKVSGRRTSEGCEIQLENACSDFSEAHLARLKDRFYQVDENRSRTGRNAGLGLSICEELISLMGGSLQLELPGTDRFLAVVRLN